jgi:peptidoglycan/xylan/chitin deacetylase (PgdA/CDA1 family)
VSLRAAVAPLAHRVGLWSGWSLRRARRQACGRIVMLHGVGAPDLPVPAFEALLDWLRGRFEVVSLDDLLAALRAGDAAGRVALTFDDGLRQHARVVAPCLARRGLPATFYVCSDLLERGGWLWTHEARARLAHAGAAGRATLARAWGRPGRTSVEALVAHFKTLAPEARAACEQALRAATADFAATPAQHRAWDLMDWDDLRGLDPALVTVGSHTRDHPILPTLDAATLQAQVAGSREVLERGLGRPVEHFCYPNGSLDDAAVAAAAEVYRSAVTTEPRVVRPGDDPHRLGRIAVDASLPLFAWRLHRPTA